MVKHRSPKPQFRVRVAAGPPKYKNKVSMDLSAMKNINMTITPLFSFSKEVQVQKDIKIQIQKEYKKSKALVTGARIACGLVTQKALYYGHNSEQKGQNPSEFIHAEKDALEKALLVEKTPLINKIVMFGGGAIRKFKNYAPCSNCVDCLKQYTNSQTNVLFLPLKKSKSLILSFREMVESYKKLQYSKLSKKNMIKELENKTFLRKKDILFVSQLINLKKSKVESIFLTGSSSGRGGVTSLIMKKTKRSYNDIDLIFIVKYHEINLIESLLDEQINCVYGSLIKINKPVPPHKNKKGVVIKNLIYEIQNQIIDITFATNIDGAFRQPLYEKRNWFHQLI